MEDCGFLLLDDDFLDLTSAEFFRILADEDLSGDLPQLPDTSESEFASEHCVDQMMDSQQRSSSEAGTIVASCFSMSLPQQTVVDVEHLTLPRHQQWQPSRASSSSCSDDCTPPQPCHVIDTVLPATSAPCSPLSTAGQVPCSSTGSMLPDLTCCAVHHCSTSSAGTLHEVAAAAAVPAAAHQAVDNKQQQQGQALSKQKIAASKRKAPEVNWRAIEDPEERRKQRRLAKNRVTAARSRERRKEQVAGMEERMAELEAENQQMRTLMAQLAQENHHLKEQLSNRISGAAAATFKTQDAGIEPAVLQCVVIMHLVACLLCVKASLGMLMLLLKLVCQQSEASGYSSPDRSAASRTQRPRSSCIVAAGTLALKHSSSRLPVGRNFSPHVLHLHACGWSGAWWLEQQQLDVLVAAAAA